MRMYKAEFKKSKNEWRLLQAKYVKDCDCHCHVIFKHCICDCSKDGLIGEYELDERELKKVKLEEYEIV